LSASQYRASILTPADNAFTFRNILFSTDFSPASNNAWWYALALARHYQSTLVVAHVISPATFVSVPPELLDKAKNWTRVEAKTQIAQLQQRQRGATRLESKALLREGDAFSVLVRLVSEHNIDLLVVGTRGHRHLKRLLLGSVAEKLFRQAPCPVLVVPGQARMSSDQVLRIRRIMCPIDFSQPSLAALALAILLTRDHDAELMLVHVAAGAAFHSLKEMHQLTDSIKVRLRQLVTSLNGLALEPRLQVSFGAPSEGISRLAVEYQSDLLVLGAHSMSATQAHQYERTAYRVIRGSQCPVLTISTSSRKGVGQTALNVWGSFAKKQKTPAALAEIAAHFMVALPGSHRGWGEWNL